MNGPFEFQDSTKKLSLPFLFAGQSQKEFFVNHALSIIDAAVAKVVVATRATPPADAVEGDVFRVSTGADDWAGKDDMLAVSIAGAWHFYEPSHGSLIFDQSANQFMLFSGTWIASSAINEPQGGGVIDVEARSAIAQVIQSLQALRLLP